MGFWRDLFGRSDQRQAETRTIDTLPWNYGGLAPSQGPLTQDRALTLAPVFAATRMLAGTISTLPLKPYRRVGDQRVPMPSLPQLFAQLDNDGELVPWLHRAVTSLVLRGNVYGLTTARDGFGFPTRVDWMNPSDVTVDDYASAIRPTWYWRGREVPREDMVHIPWFPVAGRAQGLSPLGAFMATINTGLAAQDYGNSWFDNGGFPPGTFKNTSREVNQDVADAMSARLHASMLRRRPLVFGNDWDYNPITVPPNEAQFIETMRLSASQIASIYGLPPEDVGGSRGSSLTYATAELNALDRVNALRPWLVQLEHKFASMLPERQYVKFNVDAIVRTDLRTRWDVNKIRLDTGVSNRDEIRAQEDWPPLPNGEGQAYGPPPAPAVPQAPPQAPPEQPPAQRDQRGMWVIPA